MDMKSHEKESAGQKDTTANAWIADSGASWHMTNDEGVPDVNEIDEEVKIVNGLKVALPMKGILGHFLQWFWEDVEDWWKKWEKNSFWKSWHLKS